MSFDVGAIFDISSCVGLKRNADVDFLRLYGAAYLGQAGVLCGVRKYFIRINKSVLELCISLDVLVMAHLAFLAVVPRNNPIQIQNQANI